MSYPISLGDPVFVHGTQGTDTGENPQPAAISATGGATTDIVSDGKTYRVHTFLASSDIVFSAPGTVEYFLVGGGGAGGRGGYVNPYTWNFGNGGNAGTITAGTIAVTAQSYQVVVGSGGLGSSTGPGGNGNASSFASVMASGGAGKSEYSFFTQRPQDYLNTFRQNTSPGTGASGGKNGTQHSFSGTLAYFAGGGGDGGAAYQGEQDSTGGLGGGGSGGPGVGSAQLAGIANTGGGGAGFNPNNNPTGYGKGGDGGSGIVMIRYEIG